LQAAGDLNHPFKSYAELGIAFKKKKLATLSEGSQDVFLEVYKNRNFLSLAVSGDFFFKPIFD
jgi:hypothetical protein